MYDRENRHTLLLQYRSVIKQIFKQEHTGVSVQLVAIARPHHSYIGVDCHRASKSIVCIAAVRKNKGVYIPFVRYWIIIINVSPAYVKYD
jgi:hypothetical protein